VWTRHIHYEFPHAEAVGYYFQHADVATHYIIGRDGVVIQAVKECVEEIDNSALELLHQSCYSS
jgi:hypothetical protein